MSAVPVEVERLESEGLTDEEALKNPVWVTLVWNDPINTFDYVIYVFQTYFGFAKPKARKLTNDVHYKGKAVVSSGTREQMEKDVSAMHGYGLSATLQHED